MDALRNVVSFTAEAGELVAIMGPCGSGKSTLLTIAGGSRPAHRRRARHDRRVSTWSPTCHRRPCPTRSQLRRTSIGYVFQDFNLLPALTALENVSMPRELDGTRSKRGSPGCTGAHWKSWA